MELVNQVPAAVGEKIASMIRAKKDFAAYVVCPLFPEGYVGDDKDLLQLRFAPYGFPVCKNLDMNAQKSIGSFK